MRKEDIRKVVAVIISALTFLGLGMSIASAQASGDAPVTPATAIHGLPGNNPGYGGNSANPAGNGVNGGNGIHDIADGAPGWDGSPTSESGEPPSCTIHGGLNTVNQNCD